MVLFAVDTGLHESNGCGLEWTWECPSPNWAAACFVIPPEAFKSKRAHVVVLNDAGLVNCSSAARPGSNLSPTRTNHKHL
jgi:hypothetical protein